MEKHYLNIHTDHGDLWRGAIDLGEDETLNITITQEGIIMDHYIGETGEVSSSVGMMFNDWILPRDTECMRWSRVEAEAEAIRTHIS